MKTWIFSYKTLGVEHGIGETSTSRKWGHLMGYCGLAHPPQWADLKVYGVSNAFVEDIMGHFRREISSSATCPSSASVGEPSPRGAGAPRKGKERRKGGRKMNDAVRTRSHH